MRHCFTASRLLDIERILEQIFSFLRTQIKIFLFYFFKPSRAEEKGLESCETGRGVACDEAFFIARGFGY